MSQQNMELIRRSAEMFARGDWEGAVGSFDANVAWVEMPSLGPDARTYRGPDEIRQAIQSWTSMWSDYEAEIEGYRDAGEEVVVLIRERGRGEKSQAPAERELGEVFTLRAGAVISVRLYGSWQEALEAAGLRE